MPISACINKSLYPVSAAASVHLIISKKTSNQVNRVLETLLSSLKKTCKPLLLQSENVFKGGEFLILNRPTLSSGIY